MQKQPYFCAFSPALSRPLERINKTSSASRGYVTLHSPRVMLPLPFVSAFLSVFRIEVGTLSRPVIIRMIASPSGCDMRSPQKRIVNTIRLVGLQTDLNVMDDNSKHRKTVYLHVQRICGQ